MKNTYLEFEKPIEELEQKLISYAICQATRLLISPRRSPNCRKSDDLTASIYKKLTPWQTALVARHPQRPYTLDYIEALLLISTSCIVIACMLMTIQLLVV